MYGVTKEKVIRDMRRREGSGKSFRNGLTILDLVEMFPTEEKAQEWLDGRVSDMRKWPEMRGVS